MRLGAGRPGLELEFLEPVDLGPVGHFLGLANDDHAPSSPLDRIPAIDLKHGRRRVQHAAERGSRRGAEHDGLRSLVEDVIDRTDNRWRAGLVDGDAPDSTARGGQQSQALAAVQLEELDQRTMPFICSCAWRSASEQAVRGDRVQTMLDTLAQPAESTDHRVPRPASCVLGFRTRSAINWRPRPRVALCRRLAPPSAPCFASCTLAPDRTRRAHSRCRYSGVSGDASRCPTARATGKRRVDRSLTATTSTSRQAPTRLKSASQSWKVQRTTAGSSVSRPCRLSGPDSRFASTATALSLALFAAADCPN